MRIEIKVTSEAELRAVMITQSETHAGCWVASVLPFDGGTRLVSYPSASRIPDEYLASTAAVERGYAQGGKLKPFLKSQQVREQNRGYSDR